MPKSFENSQSIKTGLSDFQEICLTALKVFYTKQKPHIIQDQSYKKFSNKGFINDLGNSFSALVGKTVLMKNKKNCRRYS